MACRVTPAIPAKAPCERPRADLKLRRRFSILLAGSALLLSLMLDGIYQHVVQTVKYHVASSSARPSGSPAILIWLSQSPCGTVPHDRSAARLVSPTYACSKISCLLRFAAYPPGAQSCGYFALFGKD